jgi:hypothetical protein
MLTLQKQCCALGESCWQVGLETATAKEWPLSHFAPWSAPLQLLLHPVEQTASSEPQFCDCPKHLGVHTKPSQLLDLQAPCRIWRRRVRA